MSNGQRRSDESANTRVPTQRTRGEKGGRTREMEGEAKGRTRGEEKGARDASTLKSSSLLSELMTSTVSCSLRFLAAAAAAAADALVGESAKNLDCTTAPPLCAAAGDGAAAARARLLGDSSTWDALASPRFEPACAEKRQSVYPQRPMPAHDVIQTYGRHDNRSGLLADGRVPARPGTADGSALSPDPRRVPAAAASAPTATLSIPAACRPCCPWSPRPLPSSETLRARALRRRLPQQRPLCPPSRRLRPLCPRISSFRPCPPSRARSLSAHAAHRPGSRARAPRAGADANGAAPHRRSHAPGGHGHARVPHEEGADVTPRHGCVRPPSPPGRCAGRRKRPRADGLQALFGGSSMERKKLQKRNHEVSCQRTSLHPGRNSACCVTPPSASPSW